MNILIVGAGNVGRALAVAWSRHGHNVSVAVRDPDRTDLVELKAAGVSLVPVKNAAQRGKIIVIAVPWNAVPGVLKEIGPVDGRVVIDVTNPLKPDLSLVVGHTNSGGEAIARLASGAYVVKAFNTTGAANLRDGYFDGGRLMMPIAGDHPAAKQTVMGLASDLGFAPVDVGPIAMCRCLEPLALLWINLASGPKKGAEFGFALVQR